MKPEPEIFLDLSRANITSQFWNKPSKDRFDQLRLIQTATQTSRATDWHENLTRTFRDPTSGMDRIKISKYFYKYMTLSPASDIYVHL